MRCLKRHSISVDSLLKLLAIKLHRDERTRSLTMMIYSILLNGLTRFGWSIPFSASWKLMFTSDGFRKKKKQERKKISWAISSFQFIHHIRGEWAKYGGTDYRFLRRNYALRSLTITQLTCVVTVVTYIRYRIPYLPQQTRSLVYSIHRDSAEDFVNVQRRRSYVSLVCAEFAYVTRDLTCYARCPGSFVRIGYL